MWLLAALFGLLMLVALVEHLGIIFMKVEDAVTYKLTGEIQ